MSEYTEDAYGTPIAHPAQQAAINNFSRDDIQLFCEGMTHEIEEVDEGYWVPVRVWVAKYEIESLTGEIEQSN